ncbi:sigma-70 family RNA polymerase sigma factor [Nocardioides sp. AX2bis]|uniref:sigma-70 family RNA polymerase sigma factor n=1 Tax=Nocardioides sp. AX2bis TaxID=2653157 RepID=UPI0012F359D3|nr:sigma-70 family RNA polymerase sigma factor [Nocardioides sp. AX2bis]VXB03457.1 conserved hypothetical protein [Nocardioides sp. AX2bis]
MTDPADFDAFYREVRERLLVQTYALTGDRAAARGAVRDAFVAAWHHRSRVARASDPEAAVREIAWSKAQRRHGARPWHRDKDVDAATRATLDALATLGGQQRRVLVLAHLASVSMPDLAREVGLTVPATEQQLQRATAAFVLALGIPAAGVNAALEPLTAVSAETTWPRSTIVRRTGVARRRAHTVVGVLGVVAALVLSGLFVSDPSGLRPTLAQAVEGVGVGGADEGDEPDVVTEGSGGEPAELLPRSTLLAAPQVARALPGTGWAVASTSDNSEGNGLVLPCQVERYVDPEGEAALVREFRAAQQGAPVRPTAVQLTEVSSSPAAARSALRTLTGWVGSCTGAEPRTQLVDSRVVEGVGDDAVQLVLRDWESPVTTTVVQVARTGAVLTATSVTNAGETAPAPAAAARLQAAAVDGVCEVRGAGPCARTPQVADAPPPTLPTAPAMIDEIDLPPVSGVEQPWVGTDPVPARTNAAATSCDSSSFTGTFDGAAWQRSSTRTFLLPEADLPTEFGLTETVGSLPAAQAEGFVERVRDRLDTCSDDLGTDVTRIGGSTGDGTTLDAWQLTAEISDDRSIRFFMAVVRQGTGVAQVGFVPAPGVALRDGAFIELAERARVRLGELPAYPTPGAGRGGGGGRS